MIRALDSAGWNVTGCDVADGPRGDCRTFFRLDSRRFDLVVHCAAVVGGRKGIEGAPLRLAAEDLSIDAELFGWALRTRPHRIAYFSSSAAYPVALQRGGWSSDDLKPRQLQESYIGHDVEHVGMPDQTYGWVKLTGERLAAEANAEGIRTHVFRPFSGYGSDQAADYPFPAFIDRARRHQRPFEVWGDGAQVRDWIHVDDVVGAVFAALDQDVIGPVNLCTGRGVTMDRLARMAMEVAGYDAPIRHVADAPAGVAVRVGCPELMRRFYDPRVTLREGIERALRDRRRAA